MKRRSGLPVVVKGVVRPDDARRCVDAGADAIIVSNHGGRALDAAVATADALPHVVDAVGGEVEVYVDGGIRHGHDVVKAVALGGRAVFIGQPWVWAVCAGGQDAVAGVIDGSRENSWLRSQCAASAASKGSISRFCGQSNCERGRGMRVWDAVAQILKVEGGAALLLPVDATHRRVFCSWNTSICLPAGTRRVWDGGWLLKSDIWPQDIGLRNAIGSRFGERVPGSGDRVRGFNPDAGGADGATQGAGFSSPNFDSLKALGPFSKSFEEGRVAGPAGAGDAAGFLSAAVRPARTGHRGDSGRRWPARLHRPGGVYARGWLPLRGRHTDVDRAAAALAAAERPVILAGAGRPLRRARARASRSWPFCWTVRSRQRLAARARFPRTIL